MKQSEDGGSQAVVRSLPKTRIPPTHTPCFPVDEHNGFLPVGQIDPKTPTTLYPLKTNKNSSLCSHRFEPARQLHCTHVHAPSGQALSPPLGRGVACLWLSASGFSFSRGQQGRPYLAMALPHKQFLLPKCPSPTLALMNHSSLTFLLNGDPCLPSFGLSQLP